MRMTNQPVMQYGTVWEHDFSVWLIFLFLIEIACANLFIGFWVWIISQINLAVITIVARCFANDYLNTVIHFAVKLIKSTQYEL